MYPPFLQIYRSVWCQKIKTFFFVLISSYFVFTFIWSNSLTRRLGLANPRFLIHGGIYRYSHANFGKGVHVCVYVLIHCLFSPRCIWLHALFLLYLFTGVSISQIVDIGAQGINGDLYMRFGSNIESQSAFYTDSNSFNMLERHSHYLSENMPISSNYYPITSAVYIEERRRRLTLLTAQPAGEYACNLSDDIRPYVVWFRS